MRRRTARSSVRPAPIAGDCLVSVEVRQIGPSYLRYLGMTGLMYVQNETETERNRTGPGRWEGGAPGGGASARGRGQGVARKACCDLWNFCRVGVLLRIGSVGLDGCVEFSVG